ncbi:MULTISPECIES: Asp-tRNA(Asn)/Glu-tRNA(Gln) amidotransferase subunit GatC [Gulbenkiania]|uniref:Aspartyl/glutamyl-tRNA(Asn/Gln) amidotransferase subunit C n=2 Tax=Gulbenkiania TaxID=397456 RepID=A0A0K6GXS3_9NEIS|nr:MULTISPECIES: Asp-tRNA(Asn)/Glu-tRNA(Gln) amidotransferase subunit GatC [Gulbenkiania]TCW32849.1 aspartyl/glutamyl-tRNA(Asn/Gln) amidotransferase subunit C [Gulbenkiania mobilis]CUA83542.1 aspartyl/glutamyl-tRNA(Asn/Gln) amidotransferase subunit C [Gulbenkiania indica]
MSLTHQDVARIARLARIAVTEDEIAATSEKLNGIFGLIEEMQAVNTDGIEPMAHPQDVFLRLREDAVTEPNRREAFQSVAPQVEKGLFLVPKVIE